MWWGHCLRCFAALYLSEYNAYSPYWWAPLGLSPQPDCVADTSNTNLVWATGLSTTAACDLMLPAAFAAKGWACAAGSTFSLSK